MNIAPWKFKNNTNTITFKTEYIESSYCTVNISVDVKPMKIGEEIKYWFFDITYSHTTYGKYGKDLHPLYCLEGISDEDLLDLYEGIIVAANSITFHMLEVLLINNPNELTDFNTGSRPLIDYQGEIMRALTEFEN